MSLPALPRGAFGDYAAENILNRLIREFNRPDSRTIIVGVDTGTGSAYSIAPVPGIVQYEIGQEFAFEAANANTGTAPTLSVNGLAAGVIKYLDGSALAVGDIPSGAWVRVSVITPTPTFGLARIISPPAGSPVLTTRGDMLVQGASGPQRLAIGGSGQYLQSNGTDPSWGPLAGDASGLTVLIPGSSGPRRLDARFGELFNVVDYGADPTGATDSTTAIQNAINAAGIAAGTGWSRGQVVFFPPGKYLVSATLNIQHDNVALVGAGPHQSQLYRTTDYGDTLYIAPTSLAVSVGQFGNHINNLGFYHNGGAPSAVGAHIHHAVCTQYEVRNVLAIGMFGGIDIESCDTGISYSNFQVYSDMSTWTSLVSGSYLMRFRENASFLGYKPCSEISVSNFDMRGGTKTSGSYFLDKGIQILSADGVWFSNGHCGFAGGQDCIIEPASSTALGYSILFDNVYFDGNFKGATGLYITNPNGGTLDAIECSNCHFTNHTGDGIAITPGTASGFHFSNSWISDNAGRGVYISGGDNYRFTGNSIRNNSTGSTTYPNMVIDSATDISVIGNHFGDGSVVPGISFTGTPSRAVVKGNTFKGTSVDIDGVTNLGSLSDVADNVTDKSVVLTSAAALTIPPVGKLFFITGTTPPTSLSLSEYGRKVTLWFTGAMTITNSATLQLAGGTFTTGSNSTLTLVCQGPGGVWNEVSRRA